jgi:cytochrome c biogenesis protein CcmG/thiol:disulfide interchange protein DsbE
MLHNRVSNQPLIRSKENVVKKTLSLILGASLLVGGLALTQVQQAEAAKAHDTIGKAPEFTLKSAKDGKTVKLSDFKGKVRIVDFWATWCPPCRGEIPHFVALQKKYKKKGLEVIGLSVDRDGPDVVNKFAKEQGINYTSLMADDKAMSDYGGIRGIPTTFVIDRDGNIVKKYVGGQDEAAFEKDIKDLL